MRSISALIRDILHASLKVRKPKRLHVKPTVAQANLLSNAEKEEIKQWATPILKEALPPLKWYK